MPPYKVKSNTFAPTTPNLSRSPATLGLSRKPSKLNALLCTRVQTALPLLMPLPTFVVALIATTILPLTSLGNKDAKPGLPFVIVPFMHREYTTVKHAIGVAKLAIILRSVTASATAATASITDMMGLTAFTPMTSALKEKAVRSTLLTLTLNVVTVLLRMTLLMSKGH